jgi:uncharacterized protein YgiM (DUF1202 family)
MSEAQRPLWKSLPALLTAVAALVSAFTGLYLAIRGEAAPSSAGSQLPADTPPPPESPDLKPTGPTTPEPVRNDVFVLRAVTDDPDGYVNLRSLKSTASEIVARIERGEEFHTYLQDSNWWQVRTRQGKVGYVHVSRIKIISSE